MTVVLYGGDHSSYGIFLEKSDGRNLRSVEWKRALPNYHILVAVGSLAKLYF